MIIKSINNNNNNDLWKLYEHLFLLCESLHEERISNKSIRKIKPRTRKSGKTILQSTIKYKYICYSVHLVNKAGQKLLSIDSLKRTTHKSTAGSVLWSYLCYDTYTHLANESPGIPDQLISDETYHSLYITQKNSSLLDEVLIPEQPPYMPHYIFQNITEILHLINYNNLIIKET